MILPLDARDEILVMDSSKELMCQLRTAILGEFPKVWVLVHHDLVDDMFGIEICNVWGGKLPKDKEEVIREYVEKFVLDRKDLD